MNSQPSEAPITTPEASGSDMAQHKPPTDKMALAVQAAGNTGGLKSGSLADALASMINQGPRRPNLQAPDVNFLDYAIRNLELRLKQEEEECKAAQQKLENLRADYHDKQLENERLRGQLRTMSKVKILQTCLQTSGALILGYSVRSDLTTALPKIGFAVGIILLLGGLLWPNGYKEKETQ